MAADYALTQELLVSHQVYRSAAEIHGVITGQLCAEDTGYDVEISQKILEINSGSSEVITSLLKMLADDIRAQLGVEDYAFQPLLPNDDEDIRARLAALADWCDGFNAGFAGAWVREEVAMAEETREVLNDFSRIAQVEQEDEAMDRENEANLMEIVEYVRMAAITVFLQNNPKLGKSGRDTVQPDLDIH
jgi:uncharacterized protein YgfB (UPF0149 family)